MMKIGLIAGSGQFPILFSKAAKAKNMSVYAAALSQEADPELERQVEGIEWIALGQVKKIVRFFKKNQITDAVMLGAVLKTRIFSDIKPDMKALSMVFGMDHTHDDGLLRAFADGMEKEGIRIRSSTFLLPHLLAPSGCWTKRKPTRSEKADITLGWHLAKEIGRLDIGQCVVVGGGSVLAVEAIDGTDATIRRGGALGKGSAVVVKVCKPNQDMRFDVPAAGSGTINTMNEADARVLVIEAGKTVVFDRQEMISLADQYGISVLAMDEAHLS
jgi:DUF1009 family protein